MNQRRKTVAVPPFRLPASSPATTAFTLIEMSIVLVIIGLIVGGVLVGQSLIRAAMVRSDIAALDSLNTAVFTFRDKYGCIPGDCSNASMFFTGIPNGNGDGVINAIIDPPAGSIWAWHHVDINGVMEEVDPFYMHLAAANLIPIQPFTFSLSSAKVGPGITWLPLKSPFITPGANAVGGQGAICPIGWNGTNYLELGCGFQGQGGAVYNQGGWKIVDAYAVDQKIDDGLPFTGSVQDAAWMNMWNAGFPQDYGCEPRCTGVGGDNGYNNTCWENQYNVQNLPNNQLGGPPLTTPCALKMKATW